jgi:hypothetical protein
MSKLLLGAVFLALGASAATISSLSTDINSRFILSCLKSPNQPHCIQQCSQTNGGYQPRHCAARPMLSFRRSDGENNNNNNDNNSTDESQTTAEATIKKPDSVIFATKAYIKKINPVIFDEDEEFDLEADTNADVLGKKVTIGLAKCTKDRHGKQICAYDVNQLESATKTQSLVTRCVHNAQGKLVCYHDASHPVKHAPFSLKIDQLLEELDEISSEFLY